MKLLSLLSLLTLFTFSCSKELAIPKNTAYYFCYSHEMKSKGESNTKYILYTDIFKVEKDEQVIKEKASDWASFVSNRCKNKAGCTSDLMYYSTIEEAEKRRNEMLENYKIQDKLEIEMVAFK